MKIPDLYALVGGDDEFMADRQAEEWFNLLKSKFGDEVETEIIDARVSNAADAGACLSRFMQAGQNLSLFGEQKIIWLRQINFIGDNQTGRAEGTKSALAGLTDWLKIYNDPNTYLLLSGSPVDRRKVFSKFFDKKGKLLHLATAKNADQLIDLAFKECERLEIRIEEEAAVALVTRVSGNTRMMMNEIEKLATYLASEDQKIITYSLVNEMVSQFGETEFFEMADAFYGSDLSRALKSVKKHFFTHKDARPVLSSLQNRNRLLIQLRSLKEGQFLELGGRQISKSALERARRQYESCFINGEQKSEYHPFGQNPWYLSRLGAIANTISLRTLISFQLRFIETFSRMIDHPNEQEQLIRDLVIDCHKERGM